MNQINDFKDIDFTKLDDQYFQIYVDSTVGKYGPYILEKNCNYKSSKFKHPVDEKRYKILDKLRCEYYRRQGNDAEGLFA